MSKATTKLTDKAEAIANRRELENTIIHSIKESHWLGVIFYDVVERAVRPTDDEKVLCAHQTFLKSSYKARLLIEGYATMVGITSEEAETLLTKMAWNK